MEIRGKWEEDEEVNDCVSKYPLVVTLRRIAHLQVDILFQHPSYILYMWELIGEDGVGALDGCGGDVVSDG